MNLSFLRRIAVVLYLGQWPLGVGLALVLPDRVATAWNLALGTCASVFIWWLVWRLRPGARPGARLQEDDTDQVPAAPECPGCGRPTREADAACPSCGARLTPSASQLPFPEPGPLVTVLQTSDPGRIGLAKSLLHWAGIPCVARDEELQDLLGAVPHRRLQPACRRCEAAGGRGAGGRRAGAAEGPLEEPGTRHY